MSHFVCGYRADSTSIDALCRLLLATMPADKPRGCLRLDGPFWRLVSYGQEKVIPDICIAKENGGSWLAILGTPLLRLKGKENEHAFLDAFLNSPRDFLRNQIDGNIAIFCYDSTRNVFFAVTDFGNTIPIFYTTGKSGVYFSSHELVLAKFASAEIDSVGFAQAIHLGVTWGSHTRFRNIFKMLPCQILTVDTDKRIHLETYWKPEEEALLSYRFDEFAADLLLSLKNSVWSFYESSGFKSVVSDFTGGEDARLIVAACHSLGIPFKAQVVGSKNDSDVIVANKAATEAKIELIERKEELIRQEDLLAYAPKIILNSDSYGELTQSCVEFATNQASPLDDYTVVKFCGLGAEELRGSYYLRGKAIFPSRKSSLDAKFFVRLKYLLDYYPGLLAYQDEKFLAAVYRIVDESMAEVEGFPIGTQIDHLLRVLQTCFLGLKYKAPLYLPLITRDLIRSVYCISPHYKKSGKLTRACTEMLFPELAFVKTQKGIPTVRKTFVRFPLFIPEYFHLMKSISNGVASRLFKWRQARPLLSMERNSYIFVSIFGTRPYSDWFSSSRSMVTGYLYNANRLDSILAEARVGVCKNVSILGRIISLELACRWVYGEGL